MSRVSSQEDVKQPIPDPGMVVPTPIKKQLWGREFDIVDEGLDVEQVIGFATILLNKCRDLEEQQKHFISLGSLTEKAAIEADKAAGDIKARARKEAAAEAARLVAEANQRTQEMMAEAKKIARETSVQEVQNIIHAALRKAGIIELQAKQQAQQFLLRSREVIVNDLKDEVKEAYHQLLSALEDLSGEGHSVEMGWKDKTSQLRKIETFELTGLTAVPSSLSTEIERTPPLVDAEGKWIPGVAPEIETGSAVA